MVSKKAPFKNMTFIDRKDAGQKLAKALGNYKDKSNTLIIALPRGGVVIGFEVATALHLPLDIVSPRKIGAPFNPELALGAITETGEGIFSTELIQELGITKDYLDREIEKEKKIASNRLKIYRKDKEPRNLHNKTVIIVDDGLATGSTMRAAIKTIKAEKAKEIIMAIPVAPPDTLHKIQKEVDQTVCLLAPTSFFAVGQFYDNFDQTTDEEVIDLLDKIFSQR